MNICSFCQHPSPQCGCSIGAIVNIIETIVGLLDVKYLRMSHNRIVLFSDTTGFPELRLELSLVEDGEYRQIIGTLSSSLESSEWRTISFGPVDI